MGKGFIYRSRLSIGACMVGLLLMSGGARSSALSIGTAVELGDTGQEVATLLSDMVADPGVLGNTVSSSTENSLEQLSSDKISPDGEVTYDSASAYGLVSQGGWMQSGVRGLNNFKAISHVQLSSIVTNNSSNAQSYSFDFTILSGSLKVDGGGYGVGEFSSAGYLVSISLDGQELFGSSALLSLDNAGAHLQQDGYILGAYSPTYNSYSWGQYSDVLDLGIFDSGESFELVYDIYTVAAGVFTPNYLGRYDLETTTSFPSDCYLYYGGQPTAVNCYDSSMAIASFIDPNGIGDSPISGGVIASPVSVPEPGIWLLMGTGLFGLAVARRRRG